jgi:hypothetical protein
MSIYVYICVFMCVYMRIYMVYICIYICIYMDTNEECMLVINSTHEGDEQD